MSNGFSNRTVYIGGYDVSKYLKVPPSGVGLQKKPEWGEAPNSENIEMEFFNHNGAFSTTAANGFFIGVVVKDLRIEIYRNQGSLQILEWSGFVDVINEDFNVKKVTITGVNQLSRSAELPALITLGEATPADLIKAVLILYNIDYDASSFAASSFYQSSLILCKLDPNLISGSITLIEMLKQLATAGFSRLYMYNGKVYIETYQTTNPTITFDLDDWHLMSNPEITPMERNKTAYSVSFEDGKVDSAGFVSGGQSQSLDFGANAVVKITSLTGAQACADAWENISKLNQRSVKFGALHKLGAMLDLQSFITLTDKQDRINNLRLEIMEIDRTDPKYTILTGFTV